jgi:hypothetical protein
MHKQQMYEHIHLRLTLWKMNFQQNHAYTLFKIQSTHKWASPIHKRILQSHKGILHDQMNKSQITKQMEILF